MPAKSHGLGRREPLEALDGVEVDVLIIGGGINGCSSAQHLAAEGYSVLLVEKGDFASAASSRSSRLLHCGLRYLAPERSPLEFFIRPKKLWTGVSMAVRSLRARREFMEQTPERIRALDMAIPIYKGDAYPGWQVDLGAVALGWLNRGGPPLHYERRDPKTAAAAHPLVAALRAPEELASVFSFRDYQFDWPERLCLDALLEAKGHGATVRNYTEVTSLEQRPGGGWRATLEDSLSPAAPVTVHGRTLLNLTGVWIDGVNRMAAPSSPPRRKIVAVKGVHAVVELPARYRGYGLAGLNREGEHFFCLPWGDLHYLGPTETVYDGDIEDVRPTGQDLEFILDEINYMLPGLGLTGSDVRSSWAGARPITFVPDRAKGMRAPSGVVHELGREGMDDALAVTWGWLMHNRELARDLVKRVRRTVSPSGKRETVSYAASSFPENTNTLPLVPECPEITTGVLRYVAEREQPAHLVDILFRRTNVGWRTRLTEDAAREAAQSVADILGWDEERVNQETRAYLSHVRDQHPAG